jgi:hypothetical protein
MTGKWWEMFVFGARKSQERDPPSGPSTKSTPSRTSRTRVSVATLAAASATAPLPLSVISGIAEAGRHG